MIDKRIWLTIAELCAAVVLLLLASMLRDKAKRTLGVTLKEWKSGRHARAVCPECGGEVWHVIRSEAGNFTNVSMNCSTCFGATIVFGGQKKNVEVTHAIMPPEIREKLKTMSEQGRQGLPPLKPEDD